jgi:glutaredoxin
VTLYTRQGCHLCEDVWVLLHREQQRHGFTLTVVDVDTDPRTVAEYGNCVPVVAVDDKVRFRGQVNPVLFTRLLQAEASRQDRPRQP